MPRQPAAAEERRPPLRAATLSATATARQPNEVISLHR